MVSLIDARNGTAADRPAGRAAPGALIPAGLSTALLMTALLCAALLGLTPALVGGAPIPAGLPDPGPLVSAGVVVLRLGLDVLGIALVGLLALPLLLPPGTAVPNRARRYTAAVAASWSGVAALSLCWRTAEVAGTTLSGISPRAVGDFVQSFGAGRGLVLTAGCGVLIAGLALARRTTARRLPELWIGIALLGLLAAPISGHASDHPTHAPAVLLVAVHVMAAAGWVGGLGALLGVFGGQPSVLATALPRFSRLATAAIVVVTVTGVLNAVVRLSDAAAPVGGGYLALLVAKTVVLLGLGALGWHARTRLLPRLLRSAVGHRPAGAVVGWLVAELVVMAFALGLAAALAQSPGGG